MSPSDWQPAPEGHPLAALHRAEVGQGVRLDVDVTGERQPGGVLRFRAFLDSEEFGRSHEPLIEGRYHDGAAGGATWLRVTASTPSVHVEQGEVEVPDGIDIQVVHALAAIVPPGGHLAFEYDSAHRSTTARALAQGVPPVATPLGGMMFSAGCGVAFTDRSRASGPGEARALDGFRALDAAHEARRGPEMLADLERFMATSAELDWDLQVKCRPLAEATITVLRARLGVLSREFASPNGTGVPDSGDPEGRES